MSGDTTLIKIIDTLKEAAASVRALEAEAEDALFNQDDTDTFRSKLEQKAMLIIDFEGEVDDLMAALDPGMRRRIRGGLSRFAASAERGLGLDSLFYLSALLYPEDYMEGEKNDLENFIEVLEQSLEP